MLEKQQHYSRKAGKEAEPPDTTAGSHGGRVEERVFNQTHCCQPSGW
jgi:hypothetical protein